MVPASLSALPQPHEAPPAARQGSAEPTRLSQLCEPPAPAVPALSRGPFVVALKTAGASFRISISDFTWKDGGSG
jgi:hypothetical protein